MKGPIGYFLGIAIAVTSTIALRFDPEYVEYNLNENATAVHPLDYSGLWEDHTYHPSPRSWRMPFYTLMLDRFINGDPSNDDINGTSFEHDWTSNQLRHGGDIQGLVDTLDYLQGMGIRVGITLPTVEQEALLTQCRACILPDLRSSISHGALTPTLPWTLLSLISTSGRLKNGAWQSKRYIGAACT